MSAVSFRGIGQFGIWLLVDDKEYYLSFSEFPWFGKATVDQLMRVEVAGPDHLRWPEIDVDLCLDSIRSPASFPLVYE